MRISVKNNPTDIVTCICGWKGQVHDAEWIQESEFGWCPDCGKEEDFEFDSTVDDSGHEKWEYSGWKAILIVYGILAGSLVFGLVPWVWGLIEEVKFIWKLF
jgi:hypothetical protein